MSKHQTNAINTSATSNQVREPTGRELTEDELAHVSGGTKASAPSKSLFFNATQGKPFQSVSLGI
jgi:bacteriocin-like protein